MKFSYQFSNLLGCPYRNGNIEFTRDGNCLIAPSGNCLSTYDLKKNTSRTLPFQTSFNITRISFSPSGHLAMAANENNDLLSISMISRSLLRTYHLNEVVRDIQWSPDGRLVAVARGSQLCLYCAPTCVKDVNPFHVVRILHGAYDDLTCLSWSVDSNYIVTGSRDGTSRVYRCGDSDEADDNQSTDIFTRWSRKSVSTCSLGGASGAVVAVFFERNSSIKNLTIVYVVTANGQVFTWKQDEEDREVETKSGLVVKALVYHRVSRHSYKPPQKNVSDSLNETDANKDNSGIYVNSSCVVKSACFHTATRILCAGFSDGSLFIHEMPSFTLIHSLSISDYGISSVRFNSTGEWLAIASKELGQIAVWEWRSEMFVLKQQGHFQATSAVAISPDGRYLASGGSDSKVKLWDLSSGNAFVTFTEHSAGIVGIAWTQSGKAVVSASLDGTIRAFDTTRYRNFRTFTPPKSTQLSCIAVDESGELVAAGTSETFEVTVWSLSTGQLLESFAGHESPVSSVTFFPSPNAGMLLSSSWDSYVRVWPVTSAGSEAGGSRDSLSLSSDVLAVAVKPDGKYFAAATFRCQIVIVETESFRQLSTIESKYDVGSGRSSDDIITAKHKASSGGQYFSALVYSPDGNFLLAAGQSRYLCIYSSSVPGEEILLKRLLISQNLSLDSNQELLNRRYMTEFGYLNNREVKNAEDDDDDKIRLPGVHKHDIAARKHKQAIRVWALDFNPGGDNFVAASSEGLLVYSLNRDMSFDPIDLAVDMTADKAEALMKDGDVVTALIIGLKLRNRELLSSVIDRIEPNHIQMVVSRLPSTLMPDFVVFVAAKIDSGEHASANLELYLKWADDLLLYNAANFTKGTMFANGASIAPKLAPALTLLQRAISNRFRTLGQLCDFVQYSIKYVAGQLEKINEVGNIDSVAKNT